MTTKKGLTMLRKILTLTSFMMIFASAAMADEVATGGTHYGVLGAGFAIGVAALGGSLGQGKAAAAAFEGIARNPAAQMKIFIPMIVALALIESLVIYALLISFQAIKV
jgi:F-type H+-transporting ATPase subunit c